MNTRSIKMICSPISTPRPYLYFPCVRLHRTMPCHGTYRVCVLECPPLGRPSLIKLVLVKMISHVAKPVDVVVESQRCALHNSTFYRLYGLRLCRELYLTRAEAGCAEALSYISTRLLGFNVLTHHLIGSVISVSRYTIHGTVSSCSSSSTTVLVLRGVYCGCPLSLGTGRKMCPCRGIEPSATKKDEIAHVVETLRKQAKEALIDEVQLSAYTKVYESVCPVGVGVHCDALPAGSPLASGCETPPKKTRGENPRNPVARLQCVQAP